MSWWSDKWKWGHDSYPLTAIILDRCPKREPRGFWAHIVGMRVTLRVTGLAALVFFLVLLVNMISRLAGTAAPFGVVTLFTCAFIFMAHSLIMTFGLRFSRGRFKRRLLQNHWRYCIECGYDLAGLPNRHQCPECGTGYEIDRLARQWQEWLDRSVVYGDRR